MVDWTVVSSVATSAAVLVVAWQAYETRRTAHKTGAAADVASGSLEVARESLKTSRNVVLEATKTRLDSRAPRLKVSAAPTDSERARHRTPVLHRGDIGPEWPRDQEFRRNGDDHQPLTLGAQFEIENEGDVTVDLSIDGSVNWLRPSPPAVRFKPSVSVTLAPGQRCEFRLEETRPLHQWIEAWENRPKESQELPHIVGEVTCDDSFDDGVIDRWRLEAWCYPIEPRPGDIAAWVLRPQGVGQDPKPPIVTARVGKVRRKYFFSKEKNEPIT